MYTWKMHNKIFLVSALLIAIMILSPLALVLADNDHDEARRLHESGEILPLELILQNVRRTHPGKVLEVELEREDGRIVYELEILGKDGIVKEIYLDARTGELLSDREDD